MAGDLPVRERAVLMNVAGPAQPESEWPGRTFPRYSRVRIVAVAEEGEGMSVRVMEAAENAGDLRAD